jgi:hypothetical protein
MYLEQINRLILLGWLTFSLGVLSADIAYFQLEGVFII